MNKSIADYTKAIEINLSLPMSSSGAAKVRLKDYQGSIADYTKAIDIDPRTLKPRDRGEIKVRHKDDYQGNLLI